MKTELILKFSFLASHSLAQYEKPHPHLWKLEMAVSGETNNGMLVDMMLLKAGIEKIIEPLKSQYLNDCNSVGSIVREFPTCETLSLFFWEKLQNLLEIEFLPQNRSLKVSSVAITICNLDGEELGAVRRS